MHRLVTVRPAEEMAEAHTILKDCETHDIDLRFSPLANIPLVAAILQPDETIHWPSTLYLSEVATLSRSVLGDTVLSYARSLLAWLNYLADRGLAFTDATERDLQLFRNFVWNSKKSRLSQSPLPIARNTVTARVETARRFHEWGEKTQRFSSPLGIWSKTHANDVKLNRQGRPYFSSGSALTLPSEQRIPKIITANQLRRIIKSAPEPYSLMFKWAVTTGLRRMELCELTNARFSTISYHGSGGHVMSFETIRKGGRQVTAYLPAKLLHDTRWYMNMSRAKPQKGAEPFVFLTQSGCKVQREELSRAFRYFANQAGTSSVFHHLRHTYAVTTLEILQRQANLGSSINPLKTLQLLMGHANVSSTEIYLAALDIYSDDVAEALDFLYGAAV